MNRFSAAVIRSAILWGSLASLGFFTLIHTGTLSDEFFRRYFAGHWIEYAETIMFFIALSQLILRAGEIADQRSRLSKIKFDDTVPLGDAAAEARALTSQLQGLPPADREGYLPRRLSEALETIRRKSTAAELEDDLRYLSDVDAGRAHGGFAMVRIIIWAIPILGFLGTVIGITMAIAGLDPKLLENSLPMVVASLGVAFDTTALALALSMVLMFGQYFVDKVENRLLTDVDARAIDLLTQRFPPAGDERDPHMQSAKRMVDAVIDGVERSVERQAEIWNATIETTNRRWEEITAGGSEHIEAAFTKALTKSLDNHRKQLTAAEEAAAEQNRKHWSQVQNALEACAASTAVTQSEVRRQAEALARVVEGTGQLTQVEQTLTANLSSLASSQHLQETLSNLSVAVNLLNARLERIVSPTLVGGSTKAASKAA